MKTRHSLPSRARTSIHSEDIQRIRSANEEVTRASTFSCARVSHPRRVDQTTQLAIGMVGDYLSSEWHDKLEAAYNGAATQVKHPQKKKQKGEEQKSREDPTAPLEDYSAKFKAVVPEAKQVSAFRTMIAGLKTCRTEHVAGLETDATAEALGPHEY